MNKNAVIITAMEGQVDISCKQYSIDTWKYWCKKNNADLIILEDPLSDVNYTKPTWQRWYIWDILSGSKLEYQKIALVDVDTMIRWDSPNFFDEIREEIGVCSDNDNIGWVKQSIEGYKLFFDKELDWTEYFNCGMIVIPQIQKNFCKSITNFWEANHSTLVMVQNNIRKGTDQTPVNYIAKDFNIKFLNKKWNLTHLNRKEILNNFMFIECGFIWHFNGFDKSMRKSIMSQTWDKIKTNYE